MRKIITDRLRGKKIEIEPEVYANYDKEENIHFGLICGEFSGDYFRSITFNLKDATILRDALNEFIEKNGGNLNESK